LKRVLRAQGIHVEFSSDHDYYWTSFVYVAVPSAVPGGKTDVDLDQDPWLSPGHPSVRDTLADMPRGARPSDKARVRRHLGDAEEGGQECSSGNVALTDKEFAAHVVAKGFRTTTELLAWVQTQGANRKSLRGGERGAFVGLEAFCFKHQGDLTKRISFAWEMNEAPSKLALRHKMAWEMVVAASELPCECDGVWVPRTEKLLQWHCEAFPGHLPDTERPTSPKIREALRRALVEGCQKHTNVFLYGPNTSGKSHVLKPLMDIFGDCAFLRPVGKGNYPLQEIFGSKICVLQDVRVSTFKLSWDDLLVWFEGEKFPVPLPRNHYDKDMMYTERAPIFVSTGSRFRIPGAEAERLQVNAEEQNRMMDSRFRAFFFPRSLAEHEKLTTPACKHCFAKWVCDGPPSVQPLAPAVLPSLAPPAPAALAAESILDWIETHGGELHLAGPLNNLAILAETLSWTAAFLPTCGRLLPFLRQHGRTKADEPDVLVGVQCSAMLKA
jgi:hypothetical protein